MCGIAGWHGRPPDAGLLRAVLGRITHRGPDGTGLHEDGHASLGTCRLAVLDPAGGAQPMVSGRGGALAFNGLAYNHMALRPELASQGARFASHHSDTETVLRLLETWGPAGLGRVDGMFALAFLAPDGSLLLARDRMGIKPLLWTRLEGGAVAFASECKALLAIPEVSAAPDLQALADWSVLEYPADATATGIASIRNVAPGTWMRIDRRGHVEEGRIGTHPTLLAPPGADPDRLLGAAVASRLQADVPFAVLLSGGLDSSLVASHARRAAPGLRLSTVACADDAGHPDLEAARRVAEALGCDHHERVFSPREAWDALPRFVHHGEMPNTEEAFLDPLMQATRRVATVALSGQGADEAWGGYARYKDAPAAARAWEAGFRERGVAPSPAAQQVLAAAAAGGKALASAELGAQLSQFQLRVLDRHAMAHSVEAREPFLSPALLAVAAATPWERKVGPGTEKAALREAALRSGLHAIPLDVLRRPKSPAGKGTAPATMRLIAAEAQRMDAQGLLRGTGLERLAGNGQQALGLALWHACFVRDRGAPPGRRDLAAVLEAA